jgi:hypothetical protein
MSNIWFEKAAIATLGYIVNPQYFLLVHRAAGPVQEQNLFPDFFPSPDCPFQVGLEVTQAVSKEDGQFLAWISKNFGKHETTQEMMADKKAHFKKLDAHINEEMGGKIAVQGQGGMFNFSDKINLVSDSLYHKTEILNANDGHSFLFSLNELFIILPFYFQKEDVEEAISKVDVHLFAHKFDKVYFLYMDELFIFVGYPLKFSEAFRLSPDVIKKIKIFANK